jgi:DNA-binding SARP family transcriptional activator
MQWTSGGSTPQAVVRLLGPLTVSRPDADVVVRGQQQAVLLALLAVARGRVLPVEQLVDLSWPSGPPATARSALRVHVSSLRRHLEPDAGPTGGRRAIGFQPGPCGGGYHLDLSVVACDLQLLDAMLAQEQALRRRGDYVGQAHLLTRALGLWRGEPLADLQESEPLRQEAARLDDLRARLEEDLVHARLEEGHHDLMCEEAARLTDERPLRERRTELLMLALYRAGRQADALAAYARLRRNLDEDLGVDPSPALQRLEGDVLRQERGLLREGRAGTRTTSRWLAAGQASLVLRSVVESRMTQLSERCVHVLRLLAVLADSASLEVLARAAAEPADDVITLLAEARQHGALRDDVTTAGLPAFAHPSLAAAVLDGLGSHDHRRLCATASEALRGVEGDRHLAAVARLALRAVPEMSPSAACRVAALAVDECLAHGDLVTAEELTAAALELVDQVDGSAHLDLLLRRIRLHVLRGETEQADRVWSRALLRARELRDPQRFALVVLAHDWRRRMVLVDSGDAELLGEALSLLGPGPSALRVRLASALLAEGAVPGRITVDEDLAAEVATSAPLVGDDWALVTALAAQHVLLRPEPDLARRAEVCDRLLAVADRLGDPFYRGVGQLSALIDALAAGRGTEVFRALRRLEALSVEARSDRLSWQVHMTRATLHLHAGDVASAEQAAETALLHGAAAGIPDALAAASTHRFLVDLTVGTVAPLLPVLQDYCEAQPTNLLAHGGFAVAAASAGSWAAACEAGDRVMGSARVGVKDESLLLALALVAEAEIACGRSRHLQTIEDLLRPYAGQFLVFGQIAACYGPVDRVLGTVAHRLGRCEEAELHLRKALRAGPAAGSPVWTVRSAADLALLLADQRQAEAASELAVEHLPVARRLGMEPSLQVLTSAAAGSEVS